MDPPNTSQPGPACCQLCGRGLRTRYATVHDTGTGDPFSIGDLAFLSGSFLRLNGLFQKILLGFTQIAGQSLYLDDLFSFFEIQPTILPPEHPKPFPQPIREGIVFDNVGFLSVCRRGHW